MALSSEQLALLQSLRDPDQASTQLSDQDSVNNLVDSEKGPGAPATSAPTPVDTPSEASAPSAIALPNGGLQGEALENYIKANPGPPATIGKNLNLGDDGQVIDSDLDQGFDDKSLPEDGSLITQALARSPHLGNTAIQPPSAQQNKDYLGDILKRINGGVDPNAAMQQAQLARNQVLLTDTLSRAGKQIASGLSRGFYKPDYSAEDQMDKMSNYPVEAVMTRQKMMQDQIESGLKASDLMDKEMMRDPNSSVSVAYRNMAVTWNPKLAASPDFQNLDAEGVKQLLPGIDMQMKMSYYGAMKNMMNDQRQTNISNKAEQDVGNKVSQAFSMRGAAGQAAKVEQAADRLIDVANNYSPDKNDLTKQQVQQLYGDMGQIMNGGVATEAGMHRIFPDTLRSSVNDLYQKIMNAPTGADMGPFVQQLSNQAASLKAVAQDYQKRQIGGIVGAYKNSLRPESYDYVKNRYGLNDDYINNFYKDSSQAGTLNKSVTPTATSHPEDAAALQWAKNNVNNPDASQRSNALQILRANGL